MKEIEINKEHSLPEGYYRVKAIPNQYEPIDLKSDWEIDKQVMDELGGFMPLSEIAEIAKNIKENRFRWPKTKTVTKVSRESQEWRETVKILPYSDKKPIELSADIQPSLDRLRMSRELWNKLQKKYNL